MTTEERHLRETISYYIDAIHQKFRAHGWPSDKKIILDNVSFLAREMLPNPETKLDALRAMVSAADVTLELDIRD